MRTEIVTPPTAEPVTLAEAKVHLRVDTDADDGRITRLIATARELCETIARRAFVAQTWDLWLDGFPASPGYFDRRIREQGPSLAAWLPRAGLGEIQLPRPPLVSVAGVYHLDAAGVERTVSPSAYRVLTGTPGRLTPAAGQLWPKALDATDAVRVRYTAGFGAASAVPSCVKDAILLAVERLYDGTPEGEIPDFIKHVLGPVMWGSYR